MCWLIISSAFAFRFCSILKTWAATWWTPTATLIVQVCSIRMINLLYTSGVPFPWTDISNLKYILYLCISGFIMSVCVCVSGHTYLRLCRSLSSPKNKVTFHSLSLYLFFTLLRDSHALIKKHSLNKFVNQSFTGGGILIHDTWCQTDSFILSNHIFCRICWTTAKI